VGGPADRACVGAPALLVKGALLFRRNTVVADAPDLLKR
jgi:hypothetical protein